MPPELFRMLGNEAVDFSLQSRRRLPVGKGLAFLLFGMFWTAFSIAISSAFVGDFMTSEPAGPDLFPVLLLGLFVLTGLVCIIGAVYMMLSPGSFFVATPSRLMSYRNGAIKVYDWEQFSGNLEMNTRRGDLILQLRTGKIMKRKSGHTEFMPDEVYISGVEQVEELERICRQRIKEHDPHPSGPGN